MFCPHQLGGAASTPHRISLRLPARRLPLEGGVMGISWERGRPARMLLLMVVAELPRGFAGSHYVGSNRNGQAEGEPGRRCRSIQAEEMAEVVPVIVRAGRPRSQGGRHLITSLFPSRGSDSGRGSRVRALSPHFSPGR